MREIGKANEVELRIPATDYLVHVRGKPVEEALLIERMLKEGKTQEEIGAPEILDLSQAQISKRLALLTLEPALLEKLKKGELRPSAGYLLAGLPAKVQREYAKQEKVTVKEIEAKRRSLVVSKELENLLSTRYEGVTDPGTPWVQNLRSHKCPKCGAEVPCE